MPDEGLGVLVPGDDPRVEVGGQIFDAAVSGSLEPFAGEFGEPALDEVQPRGAGRRECQLPRAQNPANFLTRDTLKDRSSHQTRGASVRRHALNVVHNTTTLVGLFDAGNPHACHVGEVRCGDRDLDGPGDPILLDGEE